MKRFLKRLVWELTRPRVRVVSTSAKPFVVIRRNVAERWTEDDATWLNQIMQNPRWQKLMRFSEDSICCDILDVARKPTDTEWVKGFAAGRMAQMDYQAKHGITRTTPEEPDPERLPDEAKLDPTDLAVGRGDSDERDSIETNEER